MADVEEHDVMNKRPSSPTQRAPQEHLYPSAEPPPTEADLLNPYKFSLQHIRVSEELAKMPLGMQITFSAPGIVQVIAVNEWGIAKQYGIEAGWYLLSCNGERITDKETAAKPKPRCGIRMTIAQKRPSPLNPQMPQQFLGRYQRKPNCEYAIVRLNMTKCNVSALNLVSAAGGQVCLGPAADRKAIAEFGLCVGDIIVMVNDLPVRDRRHCEFLLGMGHDWMDVVIERSAKESGSTTEVSEGVPELSLTSADDFPFYRSGVPRNVLAYGWDDDDGEDTWKPPPSDPAAGVPVNVPIDVQQIVQLGAQVMARKIVCGKSARKLSNSGKSAVCSVTKVKLDKSVKSTKLRKPVPSKSPPPSESPSSKSPPPSRSRSKKSPPPSKK